MQKEQTPSSSFKVKGYCKMNVRPPIMPVMDLSRVSIRVAEQHPEWSAKRLEEALQEYRRFLALCKDNAARKVSAPPDVDVVWHTHILDTVNYGNDCNRYFGYYLHHNPCLGPADLDGDLRTIELYRQKFGRPAPPLWSARATCANPGGGCGSIATEGAAA